MILGHYPQPMTSELAWNGRQREKYLTAPNAWLRTTWEQNPLFFGKGRECKCWKSEAGHSLEIERNRSAEVRAPERSGERYALSWKGVDGGIVTFPHERNLDPFANGRAGSISLQIALAPSSLIRPGFQAKYRSTE